MPSVRVARAALSEKSVIRHLLELYQHDFSEFDGRDIDEHGLYGYAYLDQYWTDEGRWPFLVFADEHLAGLALVRLVPPLDMSEFFILRKYRRHGVGRAAATAVFTDLPGEWQIRQLWANKAATAFWRTVIPRGFTETEEEEGPVQHFEVRPGSGTG